jgi:hypothetical protein
VVHISGNNSGNSDYVISNIHAQSGTTAVRDEINSVTLTGPFVALYSWSKNATSGLTNLVTTDTTIPNRFPTGIGTGLAPTGSSPTNTDLAGQCLMGSACSGFGGTQYTFKHAYANPPICTCTDVSGVHTCNLTVTALRSHSPGQPLTRSTTSA